MLNAGRLLAVDIVKDVLDAIFRESGLCVITLGRAWFAVRLSGAGMNDQPLEAPSERARELAGQLIRRIDDAPLQRQRREPLYDTLCARLASGTAARKLGASIDIVAPGKRSCPYHFHHAQEELFIVLEGQGSLRVAGELLPVAAGDMIFMPPGPAYPHQLINTSAAPLKYLSISTRESPELVEYPDSGKYAAIAQQQDGSRVHAVQRLQDNLDYWDGEP